MKKTGEETVTQFRNMKLIQRNDFQNFTLDSVKNRQKKIIKKFDKRVEKSL